MTENEALITGMLARRSSRPANLEVENRVLRALGQQLNQPPDMLLKHFTQILYEQGRAGTAGVSLIESVPQGHPALRWTAIAGAYAPYKNEQLDLSNSLCGHCLVQGSAQLYSYPAQHFAAFHQKEPTDRKSVV